MMRRLICVLLAVLLLPAITPRPLLAQTKTCGWILTGYILDANVITGEAEITYYYKWYCWNMSIT
jgi:hypothetical protein